MNYPIFISVVIPSYNRSVYLSKILNNLKKILEVSNFLKLLCVIVIVRIPQKKK